MQFRINSVSEAELKNKLTANDTFILAEDDENSLNNYHSYFEEAAKRFGENEFVPFKILVEEVEDDSTKRNLIWYKLPSKLDDANANFAYKEIESYPEYDLEFETVSCIFDKGADFMFNDKTDDEQLKNITGAFYIENDKIVVKSPVLALYNWNDDKETYIVSCEKLSENINLDYVENSDGSYSITPLNFPEILSSYNNKAFTVKNTNEPVSVTYSLITGE
ncbi:hypothetical protein DYE49_06015 [Treponema rectale]|nr:hypothetical protein DYE49_06015 [Treponema rectale]